MADPMTDHLTRAKWQEPPLTMKEELEKALQVARSSLKKIHDLMRLQVASKLLSYSVMNSLEV
jgi:hypothetical protein